MYGILLVSCSLSILQSVKGKNDNFKSCLIKLPKVNAPAVAPSSEQPVVPTSPVSSPNTTSKMPKTAAALPATATRCLSLVRYLTLVQEQQLAQQAQGQAQVHLLSGHVSETPQDRPAVFPAHQAHAQVQVAEVRSSSGAVTGSTAASGTSATLHVMSALERRLASLTVHDASSLVATSATATAGAGVPEPLTLLRSNDSLGDSPTCTDSNNSTSSSPVVISPSDLQSSSRVADEEREGLSEHVLLSPTSSHHAPPPAPSLSTASEEYVVV